MLTRNKVFLLGTMGLLVVALLLFSTAESQPSFQGKPLEWWLRQSDSNSANSEAERNQAKDAIHQIGAPAVPYLLRELGSRDSRLKILARDLARRQTVVRFTFTPASERRRRAHGAFHEVAFVAQSAVPALIAMLSDKDADVRMRAANCLASVAYYSGDAEDAIPALVDALGDPDMKVRRNAADALRHMKTPATGQAVPALIEILASGDNLELRGAAAMAFGQMRPVTREAVSGLTKALRDDEQPIRSLAAQALGDIGADAKEAVPELLRLAREDNDYIRQRAAAALKRIDPGAVGRDTTE